MMNSSEASIFYNINRVDDAMTQVTAAALKCSRHKTFQFAAHGVMAAALCVFGLLGNVAALLVFRRARHGNAVVVMLRALAAADCCFLLGFAFTKCWYNFPVYLGGEMSPSLYNIVQSIWFYAFPLTVMAQCVSVWVTVAVAAQRCAAIRYPLKIRTYFSPRRVNLLLTCIVIFAVVMETPRYAEAYLYTQTWLNVTYITMKTRPFVLTSHYQLYYKFLFGVTLKTFLPILLCALFTALLLRALYSARRKRAALVMPCARRTTGSREDELTRTLSVLLVVFVVTQLPLSFYVVYRQLVPEEIAVCGSLLNYFETSIDLLALVNSSVNFLIYYPTAATFRNTVIFLVRRSVSPYGSSTSSNRTRSIYTSTIHSSIRRPNLYVNIPIPTGLQPSIRRSSMKGVLTVQPFTRTFQPNEL